MAVGERYPRIGDGVKVVQKKDYATGKLTEGVVKDVLTKKRYHPRGHKVRLENGIIGRVREFVDQEVQKEKAVHPKTIPQDFDEEFDLR